MTQRHSGPRIIRLHRALDALWSAVEDRPDDEMLPPPLYRPETDEAISALLDLAEPRGDGSGLVRIAHWLSTPFCREQLARWREDAYALAAVEPAPCAQFEGWRS